MVKSMTGFAKAEERIKGRILGVEIKSFNHRFFEVTTRLPPELLIYEEKIKERLKEKIRRGSLNVNFVYIPQKSVRYLDFDEKLLRKYFQIAEKISEKLGIKNDLNLSHLLNLPGVINYKEDNLNLEKEWPRWRKILDKAVDRLIKTKLREGKALEKDVLKNISLSENSLKNIKKRRRDILNEYKKKFREKFKTITGENLSKEKLLEEASLFLRNTDISEEIVRIDSHLREMRNLLKKEEEVGRKLDFIAQEVFREINTLSAKANDYLISREVISIKSAVERIREQVQNLE